MLAERLNKAWAARRGSSAIDVVMRFADEGLVLGAGTVCWPGPAGPAATSRSIRATQDSGLPHNAALRASRCPLLNVGRSGSPVVRPGVPRSERGTCQGPSRKAEIGAP